MAKRETSVEDQKPVKKPIPWKKILTVLFVTLNVGTLCAGLYFVYSSTLGHSVALITEESARTEQKKKQQDLEAHPVIFTMEPFTVNLDGQPRRVIRTVMNLEMLDERGFEEVVSMGAQTRDAIVRLLNGKSYDDIETIQGKLFLKDQVASLLNQQLKVGVVKDIYFTEFVVR